MCEDCLDDLLKFKIILMQGNIVLEQIKLNFIRDLENFMFYDFVILIIFWLLVSVEDVFVQFVIF